MTQQTTGWEGEMETPISTGTQVYDLWGYSQNLPHRISLRILKASRIGVVMPVMVPIMLPSPKLMSIKKNMTDQNGLAGKWVIASVKAMKAKPVP